MITFSSVTKRFGNGATALENISFHVNKGEFLFLTGPSGSGKTTLMKLLTKEYAPTSGEVVFDGKPLNKIKGSQIHHHRRNIGVVFQDYKLLPELNVWENIALALQIVGKSQKEIEERVTDLLDLVQLTDRAFHFPAQLSGGEAQRVSIARALATAPGVLLADEPTGNLDPQTTSMIARLFDKIHQLGTTIFFATHDVSVLSALPHRRLYLEKGKLISDTQSGQKPATPPPVTAPVMPAASKPAEQPQPKAAPAPTKKEEDIPTHVIHLESLTTDTPASETKKPETKTKKKTRLSLPSIKLPFFGKKPKTPEEKAPRDKRENHETKPVKAAKNAQDKSNEELVKMVVEIEKL